MAAATTKKELLATTVKEFNKLEVLLGDISKQVATAKDEDGTSVQDVVAHRAHWVGLFLGWYRDGLAGKEVHFPAKGYKWNELRRYNAELRARQKRMTWSEAVSDLVRSHKRLLRFIDGKSEQELYGGPMKGARNDWTPGRWAEAAGSSHYRSASKYLRARVRALS